MVLLPACLAAAAAGSRLPAASATAALLPPSVLPVIKTCHLGSLVPACARARAVPPLYLCQCPCGSHCLRDSWFVCCTGSPAAAFCQEHLFSFLSCIAGFTFLAVRRTVERVYLLLCCLYCFRCTYATGALAATSGCNLHCGTFYGWFAAGPAFFRLFLTLPYGSRAKHFLPFLPGLAGFSYAATAVCACPFCQPGSSWFHVAYQRRQLPLPAPWRASFTAPAAASSSRATT